MIAALFVDRRGCYADIPGVDLWDEERDARLYDGPHQVVAHPPCARWCRLAGLVEARCGHKRGDDGGCFASALASVRRWGGVLEHPAYSDAWAAHGLTKPPTGGGWVRDICGGWSCYVEQGRYGHPAKKATWLYCYGVEPPPLDFGHVPDCESKAPVSWCGNHTKYEYQVSDLGRVRGNKRKRLSKRAASATPPAFRDALLDIARRSQNAT